MSNPDETASRPAAHAAFPTTINRRSALAKLGMGLAASTSLAATAIAAPDTGVSPELLRLVEAHRVAFASEKEAERKCEEAEAAHIAVRPATQIPLHNPLSNAGGRGNRVFEMSLGLDECRAQFIKGFDVRNQIFGLAEDYASPKRLKKFNALLKGMKDDGLETIEAAFAKDAEARQSSGLTTAEADRGRASAAENDAMLALCSYRCRTVAETRVRGAYMASDHLGVDALTCEHMEALLQSACAEA
jgi:hypothetical protein